MHSPQIITQSLSSITSKTNSFLASESKPATSFNTVLNKEVNNQNKVAPKANNSSNEANKNKASRQNEAIASPPKQELSKPEKSGELNKKSVEESDTQSDSIDAATADASTLLAFVDQLSQLVAPTTVENTDDIAQASLSDSTDAIATSVIDGDKLSVEQASQNLLSRASNKQREVGAPSEDINQKINQSSNESELDSSFKKVIDLVTNASDGLNTVTEYGTNQADNQISDRLAASNIAPTTTLVQQQNQTNGMNQIVANAELSAAESAAVSTKKIELGVSEVQNETEFPSKVKTGKEKTEIASQNQTLNDSTLRETFAAKLGAHQEKIAENMNRSEALENASNQNKVIEGIQNQAPPSETTKLNETVKSQVASEHIAPRLGTKAWDQAISQKVIWMVAGGEQSAELSLNPPDLGPLQVVLSISDNQVDASFISSHLDVREAIEAAAPKLKEMMDNAGIALSGFSVNAEAKSNPQQFEQGQNNSGHSANISRSKPSSVSTEPLGTPKTSRVQLGRVDTFV